MNIMYAADDNYAEIMAVSILSVIESNKNVKNIMFYIIEDGISQENIGKLRSMIEGNGRRVSFIEKPDMKKILGVDVFTRRWKDSTYSRLFLKELFGENNQVKKLIYIDCDILILNSLEDVWNEDITDYLGAGCLECMSNMHKQILGKKKSDNYFNAGFLVFNVEKWINDDVQTKIIDFIHQYNGKTEYVDQGIINGTIGNELKVINPQYNLTSLAYDFTYEEMQIYRKPYLGYDKKTWEEAKKHPVTIHFTTSFLSIRPWYAGSNHPYAGMWKEIHDRTPWGNAGYRELTNRRKRNLKEKVYRMLPRWLSVRIAGILHAYIKPMMYVLLKK